MHWQLVTRRTAGSQPELLVEYVPGSKPWWVSRGWYALSTLLLGAICYKIAFNSRCGRQEYTFVKDSFAFSEDLVSDETRMFDAEEAMARATGATIVDIAPSAPGVGAPSAPPVSAIAAPTGFYALPAQKVAPDSEPGPSPSAEPAALSAGKDV